MQRGGNTATGKCRGQGKPGDCTCGGSGRPVEIAIISGVPRKLYAVRYIKEFMRDEQGQDLVEYSLLLVLVGVASLFAITEMGLSISAIFSKVNTKLTEVKDSMVE